MNILKSVYRFSKDVRDVLVNGESAGLPYYGDVDGVRIESPGSKTIKLKASMGLELVFELSGKVTILLPDKYARYICGLCGLAVDKPQLDKNRVDRKGNLMPDKSKTGVIEWANAWRAYDDEVNMNPELEF